MSLLVLNKAEAQNTRASVSQSGNACAITSCTVSLCSLHYQLTHITHSHALKKTAPSDQITWGAMTKVGVVGAEPNV